jgi:RNA polymerase sigma-70 factor, ECF subfamily
MKNNSEFPSAPNAPTLFSSAGKHVPSRPPAAAQDTTAGLLPCTEDGFSLLAVSLRPKLVAVAYRILGNPMDAEDAVQEALWKAFRGRAGFRGESSWSHWLIRITRNECLFQLRRRRSHLPLDPEPEPSATGQSRWLRPAETNPERLMEARERSTLVQESLHRLGEPLRGAVQLRVFADRSYEQVAGAQGICVNTAKVRVHRGKQELRRILARRLRYPARLSRRGPSSGGATCPEPPVRRTVPRGEAA